jgi:hypothetical protein
VISPALQVTGNDFKCARTKYVPAAYRSVVASAKCLPKMMEPLFQDTLNEVISKLEDKFPYSYLHGSK